MKKTYLFVRAVTFLFALAALFSCDSEKIETPPEEGDNEEQIDPEPELPKTDYTLNAIIGNSEGNDIFVWSVGDEITLWDVVGKKNNTFTIDETYDGTSPSAKSVFKGAVNLDGANTLIGLYPKKEGEDFVTLAKIAVSDTCREMKSAKGTPITYMVAKGEVNDGTISDMIFKPLTTTVKFSIKETGQSEAVKINYLTIKAENKIFSGELILNENGVIENKNNTYYSVTLDMQGKELPVGGTIDGLLNILPTDLATPETQVTVNVNICKGKSSKQDFIYVFEGTLRDFLTPVGIELRNENDEITNSMIQEGSFYSVSIDLKEQSLIPEGGYEKDEQGNVVIYTPEGLLAWAATSTTPASKENVRIETKYLLNGVMDFGGAKWVRKDGFIGTFDGSGAVFTNLDIKQESGFSGLFGDLGSETTVKNITLKDIKATGVTQGLALIAAVNSGTIENCIIDGGEFEISGDEKSGLIASEMNTATGKIVNCKVIGTTNITTSSKFFGCIIGQQSHKDCIIKGAVIDKDVRIYSTGNGEIGGIIGHQQPGKLHASCFKGMMYAKGGNSSMIGGLVGNCLVKDNPQSEILGCYSIGQFDISTKVACFGGLIARAEGPKEQVWKNTIKACYSNSDLGMFGQYHSTSGAFFGQSRGSRWECQSLFNFTSYKLSGTADTKNCPPCTTETKLDYATFSFYKDKYLKELNDKIMETGYEFVFSNDEKEPMVLRRK